MTTIPNELNITINTSVPGYQKIEYKPYMTIPYISSDDNTIRFNPMIKLNKNIVDKVPENLRKKQFFNKGLFDSLLNFTYGKKADTLLEATRNGFVDNNIKVTLDAIFPENSVLYINTKPYAIADFQWSSGNWKIDTKTKSIELDSSKITDAKLYQTVIKDEIINGENQIEKLPAVLVYGENYTGPKDETKSSPLASGVSPKNNGLIQEPSTPTDKYPRVVQPTIQLKTSNTTNLMREFLKVPNFYSLIENIYNVSNPILKNIINQSLSETSNYVGGTLDTKIDTTHLSKLTYNESVNDLKIIENSGKGNCFFIAVADAINFHNYLNQDDRIISGRYGIDVNIYTQSYLRTLVSDYIQNWEGLDNYLINVAPVNAKQLNDLFIQHINGIKKAQIDSGDSPEITKDNYIRIANDIFNNNDNFLVKDIETVPIDIDEYAIPFKVLEKGQIDKYILSSNFWANEIVIYALCSKLQLNIIPFESVKSPSGKTILRIPFANFSKNLDTWNKYLFLYYYQNHFELITFNPKGVNSLETSIDTKILKKMKIIFNRNNEISELPPIYILLTVFGSYFSTIIDEDDKKNFTFKPDIMFGIQNSINNVLYNSNFYLNNFYPNFKIYFPNSNIRTPNLLTNTDNTTSLDVKPISVSDKITSSDSIQKPFEIGDPYKGGLNSEYNKEPYYRDPYYRDPYFTQNMIKKDEDKSAISYYITIDMELKPGTSLTPEELKNTKCNSKFNSIRKSWSELIGRPYTIPSIYTNTKTMKNKEENQENNKTQYKNSLPQNNTRKYTKGGKHKKLLLLLKQYHRYLYQLIYEVLCIYVVPYTMNFLH